MGIGRNKKHSGRIRIIGGIWRSRMVAFPPLEGLRPTPARVRETLFNWLQADLPGSCCLDLFAGSGILGFEALSRGAASLVQVEQEPEICRHLRLAAKALNCKSVRCDTATAAHWISAQSHSHDHSSHSSPPSQPYNVVFLDPPFTPPSLLLETCALLAATPILAPAAKIYLESSTPLSLQQLPQNWHLQQSKQAARVHYALAIHQSL